MSPLSFVALTGRHGNRVSWGNLNSTSAAVIAASMTARWSRSVQCRAVRQSGRQMNDKAVVGRSNVEVRQYFSFGGKAEGGSHRDTLAPQSRSAAPVARRV